jgi:hypothetical protein
MNVDLTEEYSKMVQYLKKEYGITYGSELMRFMIKEAYRKSKGRHSIEKSYVQ